MGNKKQQTSKGGQEGSNKSSLTASWIALNNDAKKHGWSEDKPLVFK